MQCMHICYTVVLCTDMSRLSSYIEINRTAFRCFSKHLVLVSVLKDKFMHEIRRHVYKMNWRKFWTNCDFCEICLFLHSTPVGKFLNLIFFKSLRKPAYSNTLRILPPKMKTFRWKIGIFHISVQNIDCGYLLEPPRRGGSNEYPQSMFLSRNKKITAYPCKPQFYSIKVGFKGVKTI